ncbi:Zeta-carotene desaturase, chloroplastic/chromoplastic [Capsicum annuum]|nr:Zeta-carotene desaturase, chloroplastic/chromoplastic [Capsicum annuum]
MATSSAYLCCPVTSATGKKCVFPNGPTGFLVFGGRRCRTGMSTAVELLDQGHEVDIYESATFIGGKVGSFVDWRGNHIEMGLHVFFGCYNNLFRLLKRRVLKNLLVKEHTHTFVNKGGEIGELDFRFPVGAPLRGINAFLSTNQLKIGGQSYLVPVAGGRWQISRGISRVLYYVSISDFKMVGGEDYIDSMEGATLSGRQASAYICDAGEQLLALRKKIAVAELNEICKGVSLSDELSLV